jgi:hypothetical protein
MKHFGRHITVPFGRLTKKVTLRLPPAAVMGSKKTRRREQLGVDIKALRTQEPYHDTEVCSPCTEPPAERGQLC